MPRREQSGIYQQPTPSRRGRLLIDSGNLMEMAGAGLGCYAISVLVSPIWALVAGAVCMIIAAELIYSGHVWRIPLPRRPRGLRRHRALRRQAAIAGQSEPRWFRCLTWAHFIVTWRLLRKGIWPF